MNVTANMTPADEGFAASQQETASAQPDNARELTDAYSIKNVDFRNLLTIVMGTISNQTGESFDKATLRARCADEILRRFEQVKADLTDAELDARVLSGGLDYWKEQVETMRSATLTMARSRPVAALRRALAEAKIDLLDVPAQTEAESNE